MNTACNNYSRLFRLTMLDDEARMKDMIFSGNTGERMHPGVWWQYMGLQCAAGRDS
jgi:hypothetical protein